MSQHPTMDTPLISVLMNVYNGESCIAEAIQSVLNQTYNNFEFIIVDDGSTDRTSEIIHSFSDARINYVYNPVRRHIAYAGNLALQMANGDWIARIDADDVWIPEKLEKQISYTVEHKNVGACFSFADLIDESSKPIENANEIDLYSYFHTSFTCPRDWIRHFFFNDNCICNSSSLVRKDIAEPYNLFCRQLHDFELWCRLVIKTDFYVYPEELVHYRVTSYGGNGSEANRPNIIRHINEDLLVCQKNLLYSLNDSQFVEYFCNDFRNSNSSTQLELQIERAFLLCKTKFSGGNVTASGLLAFEELLHNPEAVNLLENQYDFNLFKLYEETAHSVLFTSIDADDLCVTRARVQQVEEQLTLSQSELNLEKEKLAIVRGELDACRRELTLSQSELSLEKEQSAIVRDELEACWRELKQCKEECEGLTAQYDQLNAEVAKCHSTITAMLQSNSWRFTKPLRILARKLGRFRGN